ncbi:MAG: hypothetical protein IKR72_04735 [Bacteroidales bacterium]|nr:hypothetical protein [Bacteroidales bacterium]
MKRKLKFVSPKVTQAVPLLLESAILGSSLDNMRVIIPAQEVVDHDNFSNNAYGDYWE